MNRRGKQITYKGQTFVSYAALARHLGVSKSRVSQAVRWGRLDTLGNGLRTNCSPVTVRGQRFPMMKAAAEHFKRSAQTVSNYAKQGRLDDLRNPYEARR